MGKTNKKTNEKNQVQMEKPECYNCEHFKIQAVGSISKDTWSLLSTTKEIQALRRRHPSTLVIFCKYIGKIEVAPADLDSLQERNFFEDIGAVECKFFSSMEV